MQDLSQTSQVILYILIGLMGILAVIILWWQIQVLRGKNMDNPDGTVDSWHEHKIFYGIAIADIFLACPLCLAGIALVFISPRWGYYLLTWVSFWFVWANTMTTATSLRFEKPKITATWLIVYPFGILVGLAFFIWTLANFNVIYS